VDLRSGRSISLLRLPGAYPPLERNESCEVAVLGAGVTGALVGRDLARAGFDTLVLDRREAGWGSTAASTSIFQYEIDKPLVSLARIRGEHDARRAYRLAARGVERLLSVSKELGQRLSRPRVSLYAGRTRRDETSLRGEFDARRACGLSVHFLTSGEVERRWPFRVPCAILSDLAGEGDAYGLTHALLSDGGRAGLRAYDRTGVTSWRSGRRVHTLTTDRGSRVRARWVVIAAGYEAGALLGRRLCEMRDTFAVATEPGPAWRDGAVLWQWGDPYLYARTSPDRRVMVGGADIARARPSVRDAMVWPRARLLLNRFRRVAPALATEPAFAWAGTFGQTRDGLGHCGPVPGRPRTIAALGYGGNGMVFAAVMGEIIAALLRRKAHADQDLMALGRRIARR
jgi:glycine/D-amino acid oxidase-like deaminating enzyme